MIEIPSIQPRLLTKGEAARYCRLNPARFSVICPVRPIALEANKNVYDIKELDGWIDSLKKSGGANSDEDILERI